MCDNIEKRLMPILNGILSRRDRSLTMESSEEDLCMDSLDQVDVIWAIEDEFGFTMPDDDIDRLNTPRQMHVYIAERTG